MQQTTMMAATNAGVSKTGGPSLSEAGMKAISTDIFGHLLERQVPQQAQLNALFATAVGAARFPFGSKRATYIGWIFQLSSRLGFGPDTGASAVVLMDRTLLVLGRACPRLPEDGKKIPLSFLNFGFHISKLSFEFASPSKETAHQHTCCTEHHLFLFPSPIWRCLPRLPIVTVTILICPPFFLPPELFFFRFQLFCRD